MFWIWTPVEARFSTPIQTGPGPHPASFTTDSESLSQWYSSQDMALITHPHPTSRLSTCRAIPWTPCASDGILWCDLHLYLVLSKWYKGNMEEDCAVLTNLETCNKDCDYNQGDSFLQTQSNYLYVAHICFKKFRNSGRLHHQHTTALTWPDVLILVHNPIQRWIFVKFTLNFTDFHKCSPSHSPVCNIKWRAHQAIRL